MRTTVLIAGISAPLLAASLVAPLHNVAAAQNSQLQQTITLDCLAMPSSPACSMSLPSIDMIDVNDGRPIVSGKYDSTYATSLRVTIDGVTYVLDTNSELTAVGDTWRLDLSRSERLPAGIYSIDVESIDNDGKSLSASASFVVHSDESGINSVNESNGLANTGQPVDVLSAVAVIAILVAFSLFIVAMRWREAART